MKKLLTCIIGIGLTVPLAFAVVVSPPAAPSVSAGGNSFNPVFSADGQKLVFVSHANNLVTNDDLGLWLDVFVRDLVTSNTVLVSVSTNGTGGANSDANYPSVSANGQFIAFVSSASNLVPGATNGLLYNVFVRDVNAGLTRLASADTNGNPASAGSVNPRISADGRYVVFESYANNLTGDSVTLGDVHLYRRDLWSNITVRASQSANANPSIVHELGSITPDGSFTAYSRGTNSIIPSADAFVHQVGAGTTWVSVNVAGLLPSGYRCSPPVISDDGRYAAFYATPSAGGNTLALHHDTLTGTTLVISPAATNLSHGLQISANGQRVLLETMDGTYARPTLWETTLGGITGLILCNGLDLRGNPAMTPAGLAVAYIGCSNVYLTAPTNLLVSASTNGSASNGDYQFVTPAISPDGTRVAFAVNANDLAPGDLNGQSDIFLRDVTTGGTELITKAVPSKPATTAFAHSFLGPNSISADGRFIVSTRYDDPSARWDTNGVLDIFLSDKLLATTHALSLDTNLYFIEGGGGPGYYTNAENTNYYYGPIISADGSAVVTLSRLSANVQVMWVNGTNGVFGSRFRVVNHTGNSGVGAFGYGDCSSPSISSNGWSVVFTTTASDYTYENATLDNNNATDVVLRRIVDASMLGTNYLVSVTPGGVSGNGASSNGVISLDGRWVIFESMATDLVPGTPVGKLCLFARDLWSNTTYFVNVPQMAAFPNHLTAGSARFSGNSRRIVFTEGSSPSFGDILRLHDLYARTTADLPVAFASNPALNFSGSYVVFLNRSATPNQAHGYDLQSGQSSLLSVGPNGVSANDTVRAPIVSGDGRYVIFPSWASNLVPNAGDRTFDLFVRDRLLGVTMLLSGRTAGKSRSTKPVLAANGRTVVFQSFASDLAAGDFNDMRDLYVLTLGGVDSEPDGMDDDWEVAYFNNLSHDGTVDSDNDGATDLQEFLAGTDPTNANSVFRVLTIQPAGGGAKTLLWSGNPTRSYRAEFKDDLAAVSWTALTGTISWNETTASISDPTAGSATNRYYRVLRLP